MTWWRNAWWVRVNNGPHLQTARDRRRVWRAATRPRRKCATRERSQGEKGRNGSKGRQKATPCTSFSTSTQQPQQLQHRQQQCVCNDAGSPRRDGALNKRGGAAHAQDMGVLVSEMEEVVIGSTCHDDSDFQLEHVNVYHNEVFGDFDAIDFKDCFEVKWSKDMTTLPAVSGMRLLAFWPVPPKCQSREARRRDVLERLPTRSICIPCRTLLTNCTSSVITGLHTDCYVRKCLSHRVQRNWKWSDSVHNFWGSTQMTGPFNQEFVNKDLSCTVSSVSPNVAEETASPSARCRKGRLSHLCKRRLPIVAAWRALQARRA